MSPNRSIAFVLTLGLIAFAGPATTLLEAGAEPAETLPPGVEQLLPRGGIPAIFEPVFVTAADAVIPDDAWILGVSIGDEARAYSLNLLNAHEIVNDRIGEKNFAAVW